MSAPPKTVLDVGPDEAEAIRARVRAADPLTLGPGRALAAPEHVEAVLGLLADPAGSDPIYDLPRPFTRDSVAAWIAEGMRARAAGEGLLIFTFDAEGVATGYSKITVWPQLSAAELGGALRADRQGGGSGGAGALHTFGWIFQALGVRLMCLTAALDNVRSAKLIDAAGFARMGERDAVRPDGTVRRSLYWEVARADFLAREAGQTGS